MKALNQSLALAGCIQFTWWAHRIAQHGEYRLDRLQLAADSVFCTDPQNVMDVYGGKENLVTGIDIARAILGKREQSMIGTTETALITGYVGNLLRLASSLLSNDEARRQLASGISELRNASQTPEEPPVMDLAGLYTQNISPLSPRIMIQGNGIYLQNEDFAAGIRCHLLAALRSAVLWRQSGGRIWLLMFQRAAYLRELDQIKSGN